MTHGSLFSGIGGFDLAASWMGWENKFHCEWNEFGQKVLNYYWPDAESFGDITKTDFKKYNGTIDIISGGFPCQPYSTAGKRKGKEDDRHLWPQMLRAIREIQPHWVVGENVRGLTNWNGGMVFDEVQSDLENEGYEVLPFLLPACAVNAPHRRDRIWFIAYSISAGTRRKSGTINNEGGRTGEDRAESLRQTYGQAGTGGVKPTSENAANSNNNGPYGTKNRQGYSERNDDNQTRAHTTIKSARCSDKATGKNQHNPIPDGGPVTPNTRLQRQTERQEQPMGAEQLCEERIITNSNAAWQRGNEWKSKGEEDLWEQFPTQPPLCGGDDGLSTELAGITFSKHRNESIKGYGNAIVPQVAYQIFKAIEQYEQL